MKIFLFLLLMGPLISAQSFEETFYLSPSIYYTSGDYSTDQKSKEFSFYNTVQLMHELYLINHYDYLLIDANEYDYKQQTFLAGGLLDMFPYYFKFHYSHYKGEYNYTPTSFTSQDFTNLYNIDVFYYINWFYFGASYAHLNQIGSANLISNQITLRIEKILSDEFFISFKPNYTHLSDGQNLYSSAVKLHYAPLPELVFKVGGFIGKRAFYFDSDLLTIYNQNDIQKYQVSGLVDFVPISLLKFTLGYQHNKFTNFNVNYLFAGIKANFNIAK